MRKIPTLLIGLTMAAFAATSFAKPPVVSSGLQVKTAKASHGKKVAHKPHAKKKHAKKMA